MDTVSNDPNDLAPANEAPATVDTVAEESQEQASPVEQSTEPGEQNPNAESDTKEPQLDGAEQRAATRKERLDVRFTELTKRNQESLRMAEDERLRRERAEEELAHYKAKPQAKPVYENYSDPYTYADDLAKWQGEQSARETEARIRKEYADKQELDTQRLWLARQNEAKKEYADYDVVVQSATATVSKDLERAILESEYGPHLLYRLADDDALVAKLQRLPTAAALMELGKIEAGIESQRLHKKPVNRGSNAPEPITPLKQSAGKLTDSYTDRGDGCEIVDNADNYRRLRIAGKIR